MRRIGLSLALLFAFSPGLAQSPATATPAPVEAANPAEVDRLLAVMDMQAMLSGMMQQVNAAQEKMVLDAFDEAMTESERKEMQEVMASASAIVRKHMGWTALEPVVRKVYLQLFTRQEVQAMIAFYTSAEGASILKKSPQAMAITMQEIQPIATAAMTEAMSVIEKRIAEQKKRKD